MSSARRTPTADRPLAGAHVVSLALNLPGPAALARLRSLGARCTQVEPPAGDPMRGYCEAAYAQMHRGVRTVTLDLKTPAGQRRLQRLLAGADVLLTSFRPSALAKLGLDAAALQARHPRLCVVRIVGAAGARAEEAGHDLTYQAEAGLLDGLSLPPSLLADMAGALLASEAVQAALLQRAATGRGTVRDALTVFDENGALLHAPPALWAALRARDWRTLFVRQRAWWREAAVVLFGHALLEQLQRPHKALTAHVLCVPMPAPPPDLEPNGRGDGAGPHPWDAVLAATLDGWSAEAWGAKPFTPLPVLGVPGWWPDNVHASFYDDTRVFRPPRPPTPSGAGAAGALATP
ncbi:MAG: DUF3025 domain-containing protein [Tepidimonas sp.]